MGSKANALLGYLSEAGQRKDLKSAAIGKYRSLPIHKLMKSAHIVYELVSGTDMQMVGIGELYLTVKIDKLS